MKIERVGPLTFTVWFPETEGVLLELGERVARALGLVGYWMVMHPAVVDDLRVV